MYQFLYWMIDQWRVVIIFNMNFIICTMFDSKISLQKYLKLLQFKNRFCQINISKKSLSSLNAMTLMLNNTNIVFNDSTNLDNIKQMLNLTTEKNIKTWIQMRFMKNVNTMLSKMKKKKAKYKFVLQNRIDEMQT